MSMPESWQQQIISDGASQEHVCKHHTNVPDDENKVLS